MSTFHTGTAILIVPVPLGIQPGTFGSPHRAPLSTVQPMPAGRKHRPYAEPGPVVSAEDRRRPLLSAKGHSALSCVI